MATQAEIRQGITQQIVAALRAGTPPWRKPWLDMENAGHPANIISKRPYTGINPLLLDLVAMQRGYQSRWWGTFRQWQSLGLHVQLRPADVPPGAWGTKIVFYKPIIKTTVNSEGEDEEDRFFLLRTYTVFNAHQVQGDGLEKFLAKPRVDNSFVDFHPAEEVIRATGADIRFGGSRAVYCPEMDFIQLPVKSTFRSEADFYSTLFHEACHWTGHPSRLGRLERNARFGNAAYAFEELIAEIASCYLAAEVGVPQSSDLTNHHAYLAIWLRVLESNPRAIIQASSQASKAVDFILSFSRKTEDQTTEGTDEPVAGVTD